MLNKYAGTIVSVALQSRHHNLHYRLSLTGYNSCTSVKWRCTSCGVYGESFLHFRDVKSVKSRELKVLQSIGAHDFVIRFYGMYLNEGLFVGLLYEYSDIGNWDDFIYEVSFVTSKMNYLTHNIRQAIYCEKKHWSFKWRDCCRTNSIKVLIDFNLGALCVRTALNIQMKVLRNNLIENLRWS